MRHTITLTKYSNVLDLNDEGARKFQINPGFIVAVEELAARSDANLGVRTRVDYALPGFPAQQVLVWESSDEIDAKVAVAREAMRQALLMREEEANAQANRSSD
jgi:hypothetical protein